jgi:hypothetical protein
LRETDGVYDREGQYEYAWSLARIVSENSEAWVELDGPLPEAFLAIGSDGAGDWFCIPSDRHATSVVLHWAWIEFVARQIAPDLMSFWTGWFSGELTV